MVMGAIMEEQLSQAAHCHAKTNFKFVRQLTNRPSMSRSEELLDVSHMVEKSVVEVEGAATSGPPEIKQKEKEEESTDSLEEELPKVKLLQYR